MFNRFKGSQASADSGVDLETSVVSAPSVAPKAMATPTGIKGVLAQADKPAIVSEQFTIRGDIDSEGTLHVEGHVIGVVRAHTIHISSTGHIEGDVVCESLNVKGTVTGSIVCQELVMAATARIKGKICYQYITVGAGARLDGDMSIDS